MNILQSLKIALRGLTNNKMRTALTMLGIIIGVGVVILVVAIGKGATKRVTDTVNSLGTNLLTVFNGRSRIRITAAITKGAGERRCDPAGLGGFAEPPDAGRGEADLYELSQDHRRRRAAGERQSAGPLQWRRCEHQPERLDQRLLFRHEHQYLFGPILHGLRAGGQRESLRGRQDSGFQADWQRRRGHGRPDHRDQSPELQSRGNDVSERLDRVGPGSGRHRHGSHHDGHAPPSAQAEHRLHVHPLHRTVPDASGAGAGVGVPASAAPYAAALSGQ